MHFPGGIRNGILVLGLLAVPPVILAFTSMPGPIWLFMLVYSVPAGVAADYVDKLYLELYLRHVDPYATTPTYLGSVVFFSVLAAQTLLLAWWIGGGRTWPRRLLRGLAITAIFWAAAFYALVMMVLAPGL